MPQKRTKVHSEAARENIRTGVLLRRLADHAVGKVEMTPTQVRAAEILLKKAIPDLSSIEHSGTVSVASEATEMLRALNEPAETVGVRPAVPAQGDLLADESGSIRH